MPYFSFLLRLPLLLVVGSIVVPQHLLLLYFILIYSSIQAIGMFHTFCWIACYIIWVICTNHLKYRAGQVGPEWAARLIQWAFKTYLDTLGCELTIINEYIPDPNSPRKVVACYNPHGSFATGGICYAMANFRLHPVLRKLEGNLMAASVIFYVPIMRELLMILGCRDAGKKTVASLLEKNRSLGCSPGGIWEQLHTDSRREQCFVMRNMGFLRLALKHGRPVVPIYAFGESQLYTTYDVGLDFRKWLARKCYLGVSVATGRFGLPFPLIPHPIKMTIVSGLEVDLGPPNPNPTAAELDAAFQKYSAELHRLFDKYKDRALPKAVAARGFNVNWRSD